MGLHHSPNAVISGLIQCIDPANPRASGDTGDFVGGNAATKTFPLELTINTTQGYSEFNANSFFTVSSTGYPATWSSQLTIDTWIYVPTSATWSNGTYLGAIILRGSYTGHVGLGRNVVNNQIVFSVRGDAEQSLAYATITRDTWHHVSCIWNGEVASIAVNGNIIQSSSPLSLTGTPENDVWNFGRIGAFGGDVGNKYVGRIGTTKIYNRSLSAEEVRQNFNALRARYAI